MEEVKDSDVVVVLVGERYGTLAEEGLSFTHHEVRQARAAGIPVLCFIKADPGKVAGTEAARRRAFANWLRAQYTCAGFTDETSLITEIAAALRRLDYRLRSGRIAEADGAWMELIERANSAANWDCVAVAAHNVDHLYPVDCVAADYETRIKAPIVVPGGSGANTAAGLGRMGLRVAAAGAVGSDEDGARLREALEVDAVEPLLAPLPDGQRPTGRTLAFADHSGRRSIYVEPGANERFAVASRTDGYMSELRAAVSSARVVHYSSFTLAAERGLQEKLTHDLPERALLSLTPGALYCKLGLDRLAPLLRRANILFVYEQQLDMLLGQGLDGNGKKRQLDEKLDALYAWKKRNGFHEPLAVVIKNASSVNATTPQQLRGAVGRTEVEAIQPTQASIEPTVAVRDGTGAGDASAAGLLWAVLQMQPLHYAIDISYVFARSASSRYGGREGLPNRRQLKRRWKSWVGSLHDLP